MKPETLRLSICIRTAHATYRLAWITESKDGIYIGLPATMEEYHGSYHKDGMRHTRINKHLFDRYKDVAPHTIQGVRKLEHIRLPLTKNWFPQKTLYTKIPDIKSVLLLEEHMLVGMDTLSIDLWLSDLTSTQKMQAEIDFHFKICPDRPEIAREKYQLHCYPQHQIALGIGAGKMGGYTSDELLITTNQSNQSNAKPPQVHLPPVQIDT
jgi:hypothetical protein